MNANELTQAIKEYQEKRTKRMKEARMILKEIYENKTGEKFPEDVKHKIDEYGEEMEIYFSAEKRLVVSRMTKSVYKRSTSFEIYKETNERLASKNKYFLTIFLTHDNLNLAVERWSGDKVSVKAFDYKGDVVKNFKHKRTLYSDNKGTFFKINRKKVYVEGLNV